MRLLTLMALIAGAATLVCRSDAQTYDTNGAVVQTFAGSGFSGYVDGVGQLTMFKGPLAIVADSQGNLFVWDNENNRIRRISPDATVTTFAGGGNQMVGIGTNVNLVGSYGGLFPIMTIDRNDTIWLVIYPSGSPTLCRVTSGAVITRTNLALSVPAGICCDSVGNIYISCAEGSDSQRIYRYTTNGVLGTFVGSGNYGYEDGNGIFTAFNNPKALAADAADNIYVWDSGNALIRRIDQNRNVTTFVGTFQNGSQTDGVGTNVSIGGVNHMVIDNSGSMILAGGTWIRKISAATVATTIAGSFSQGGFTNGQGDLARFNGANGVCIFGGTIYVADYSNQRIRSITNNPSVEPVLPANLHLSTYPGLQIVGTVGRTYRVESSPDTTNWTASTTLLLTSSPFLWFDQNPLSGNKFYRALLLP